MVCITKLFFKGNFMRVWTLKFYFFQNSDNFAIGSPMESSNVLLVDMLDCFAQYAIYIYNKNISIQIFVRGIQSFCRLSNSPSVQVIYKYCRAKNPCRRFWGDTPTSKNFSCSYERARSLVVSDLRWETKGSRFESGCYYVRRWTLCSNRQANV